MEIAAVFVKKQIDTDVFEGQERDGRRRGRKDGGRTEEGQREDRGRTEGGRSLTIIHTRSGGAGIVA